MKPIEKGYLGFAEGIIYGQSQTIEASRQMNWFRLKEIIETNRDNLKSVHVGLAEDWGYTSGEVWNSEKGYIPKEETDYYVASFWATPAAEINYIDGTEKTVECWVFGDESNGYFNFINENETYP